MKHSAIKKKFEEFLREQGLRLTPQRTRIFDRAFSTHDHFTAEVFYGWMREEDGPKVSRATVYRTLAILVEGGFLESFDLGQGEQVYEHVMGHRHHDHLVCMDCGRIEEFMDDRIEEIQAEIAASYGFQLVEHDHRLRGYCRACAKKREKKGGGRASSSAHSN